MRANETYSEANRQFSDRNRTVLMNVQTSHKWWSTFTSAVFGTSSSLSPIVNEGGGLGCETFCKADLLEDHFGSKQSREAVDLPLTCHPSPTVVLPPLLQVERGQASLVRLGPLWWHSSIGYVSSFS